MAKNITISWCVDNTSTTEKFGIYKVGMQLGIVEKTSRTVDGITDEWKAVTEALTVRYNSVICDGDLTGIGSEWHKIESKYHKTIVNKVIAMGYQDPRNKDLQSAQYFDQLYERDIKRAKKFSKGQIVSTGRIIPQDF